jgi:hypothetical protein
MKTIAILSAGLAFALAGALQASVIQADYKTAGDGLITLDTVTGLEWLDAPVTLGDSPNQAIAANPGFELATLSQVVMLLEDAGLPAADVNSGTYFTADLPAQNKLSQLLRLTDVWVQYYGPGASGWEYEGFGNVLSSGGNGWGEENLDARNPPLGSDGAYSTYYNFSNCLSCSSSLNFNFLVSTASTNVPEPASLLLMGLALIALARKKLA